MFSDSYTGNAQASRVNFQKTDKKIFGTSGYPRLEAGRIRLSGAGIRIFLVIWDPEGGIRIFWMMIRILRKSRIQMKIRIFFWILSLDSTTYLYKLLKLYNFLIF